MLQEQLCSLLEQLYILVHFELILFAQNQNIVHPPPVFTVICAALVVPKRVQWLVVFSWDNLKFLSFAAENIFAIIIITGFEEES